MKPKILILDVETAPLLSFHWGLFDQTIGLNQIKSDWHLLSFAAKWLDSKNIVYSDQRNAKNIENDKPLLEKLWKLIDEADIIITQNGISFDIKKINARFILNGMKPPSGFKNIDTKRIASNKFGFTSNKLEYLTDKLCTKYKKLTERKFNGFKLWTECLKSNKKAFKEMEKYNKLDVLSLEELYKKLIPWDSSINFSLWDDKAKHSCTCGSKSLKKYGFAYTSKGKYQRYVCNSCGKESRSTQNLFNTKKVKSLLVKT